MIALNPSRVRTSASIFVLLAAAASAGCSGQEPSVGETESALDEAATPRKGSSISSPSVDPNKMYWGARTINMLVTVGALTAAEASVAARADGILANTPRNGKVGVDELASLESPDHIDTLFPEEKAVLPKLWKLLEIEAAPSHAAGPVSLPMTVHDAYDVAPPFQLPISALGSPYSRIASRIELTQNDDGDPATISAGDVARAYADRGSYLPEEVQTFRTIHVLIGSAAPRLKDTQFVEVPATTTQTVASFGGYDLIAENQVQISGRFNGNLNSQPVISSVIVTKLQSADAAIRAVTLDSATGVDALVSGTIVSRPMRVEVWKGGVRIAQANVGPSTEAGTAQVIPFGYAVMLGTTRYVLNCSNAGCEYEPSAPNTVATMPATSYDLEGQPGRRLDLFPNGRGLLIGGGVPPRTCFPAIPVSGRVVGSCHFLDPASGARVGSIGFDVKAAEAAPQLGNLSVSSLAAALYVH